MRLGPKTIICGYENLFERPAEYTYKALMPVDAYGLRKRDLKPLLNEELEFKQQMCKYTLEYYHNIVRQPMLTFKRNIYSAVCKRQTEEAMMRQIDEEIREKEEQYEEDLNKDWEEEAEDENGQAQLQKKLDKRLERINKQVKRMCQQVRGLDKI